MPIRIYRQRVSLCVPLGLLVLSLRKRYNHEDPPKTNLSSGLFSKLSYGLKSAVQVGETTMKSNQTKFQSVMCIKRGGGCEPCNPAKSVLVEERAIK